MRVDPGTSVGGGVSSGRGKDWYDTAQICTSGHVINSCSISMPHLNRNFCERCGAPTITECPYQGCHSIIRGEFQASSSFTRPSFCSDCGQPYPWTEAKIKAAQELADELDNLSLQEREMLKRSLDDIVKDSPQTTVAATRFKKLAAKAGKVAADGFRDILVDVLSEATKRIIWPK